MSSPQPRSAVAVGGGHKVPILLALIAGYAIGAVSSPFLRLSTDATQQSCPEHAAYGSSSEGKAAHAAKAGNPARQEAVVQLRKSGPVTRKPILPGAVAKQGSSSKDAADHPSAGKAKPVVVKKRKHLKCSEMDDLRTQYVEYLTSKRTTIHWANTSKPFEGVVMNHIGQMDAEVLLPLISDLAPHEVRSGDKGDHCSNNSCVGGCTRVSLRTQSRL